MDSPRLVCSVSTKGYWEWIKWKDSRLTTNSPVTSCQEALRFRPWEEDMKELREKQIILYYFYWLTTKENKSCCSSKRKLCDSVNKALVNSLPLVPHGLLYKSVDQKAYSLTVKAFLGRELWVWSLSERWEKESKRESRGRKEGRTDLEFREKVIWRAWGNLTIVPKHENSIFKYHLPLSLHSNSAQ